MLFNYLDVNLFCSLSLLKVKENLLLSLLRLTKNKKIHIKIVEGALTIEKQIKEEKYESKKIKSNREKSNTALCTIYREDLYGNGGGCV